VERPAFEEVQRFPLWIKAIVLLPVVVLAYPAIRMWLGGPGYATIALIVTALALFFLLLGVPNFVLKLLISIDSSHLRLKIYPLGLPVPFLPPRIWDVPLSEISHSEVRTYKPLLDREYWGPHLWGLGSAFGGDRYLYAMKPSLFSARGVQLQLRSGERLFLGSEHPEEGRTRRGHRPSQKREQLGLCASFRRLASTGMGCHSGSSRNRTTQSDNEDPTSG
jgi:hypothetical protein